MKDVFDAKILCEKCNIPMAKIEIAKDGVRVRAVECPKCKEKIIHPEDKHKLEHFKNLKGRTFSVKLRMVGNSHTISIPKEIVDFMEEFNRMNSQMTRDMDNMVKLCFEDFGKLRVDLFDENNYSDEDEDDEEKYEEAKRSLKPDNIHKLALKRVRGAK